MKPGWRSDGWGFPPAFLRLRRAVARAEQRIMFGWWGEDGVGPTDITSQTRNGKNR